MYRRHYGYEDPLTTALKGYQRQVKLCSIKATIALMCAILIWTYQAESLGFLSPLIQQLQMLTIAGLFGFATICFGAAIFFLLRAHYFETRPERF